MNATILLVQIHCIDKKKKNAHLFPSEQWKEWGMGSLDSSWSPNVTGHIKQDKTPWPHDYFATSQDPMEDVTLKQQPIQRENAVQKKSYKRITLTAW